MTNKSKYLDLTAMITLVVLCASWGLQQVAIKVATPGISPILQAGMRSSIAAVLLVGWMLLKRIPIFNKDGTLWWGLAAGSLFAAEFIFIYVGIGLTNVSRAVIFLYTSPFVVAIGAHWFIPGEKMGARQIVGLVCAFAGIVTAFGESIRITDPQILIGDSLLILAAIFWGATTVLIKATNLSDIEPSKTLLYQLAVSGVVMPIASLIFREPGIIKVTTVIVASLAYQSIWVAFITYTIWFWLIKSYSASRLSSFTFLTPLFGVIAGAVLLSEPITFSILTALFLVGAGIYLVNRPEKIQQPQRTIS